ncbi:MAG: hypothetical protein GIW97_03500 [Candidatus Eremiobacteraeota bacterium]|nr:hypothetical protein [Candidatus Eremiobacteraeota bacterium]
MDTYLIGGGAILEAGERSTITRVTLHAQLTAERPEQRAVLIDFESGSMEELGRLVALASGMTAERFETTVTARLLDAGVCGLVDVAAILADEVETSEVHLFARWTAPQNLVAELAARGVQLHSHTLESIDRAAVIAEHRFRVWPGAPRAA